MARRREARPIYEAAAVWRERCFFGSDAMFIYGANLWTLQNLMALRAAFTGTPLSGSDSFLDKFKRQIGGQPEPVIHLAAEMLWVLFLFPRKLLGVERKRELITTVWGWAPAHLDPHHRLLSDSVLAGIGSAGTAFNTQRDRELEALIDVVIAVKQKGLPADAAPEKVVQVIDSLPAARARNIRHILLHLLYPDQFERIASLPHKREILKAFSKEPVVDARLRRNPYEADQRLLAIRTQLEESLPGRDLDFYDPDLYAQWAKPKDLDKQRVPKRKGSAAPSGRSDNSGTGSAQGAPSAEVFLDPNTATREALLVTPAIDAALADALIRGRPYADMTQVDRLLGNHRLTPEQRTNVYLHLWKPLDVNSATGGEMLLIPGIDRPLAYQIEAARPFRSLAHFRSVVGRNLTDVEVDRLERYIVIGPRPADIGRQALAGLSLAEELASRANFPEPTPDLILAAFLLLAHDAQLGARSALALHTAMQVGIAARKMDPEAPGRLLLQRYDLHADVFPGPGPLPPGPFSSSILASAGEVRDVVATAGGNTLSARHVIALLLVPGRYSALPVLEHFGFSTPDLREAFLASVADAQRLKESPYAWRQLLSGSSPESTPERLLYAGFSADALGANAAGITREDDRLGVLKDVTALCEVLAARQTRPPLAVGLFGDWGTGKSFFMELMRKEVEALGRQNSSFYCDRVVQVWFNAWHYMDTNLWASLAARVFEELAEQPKRWEPDEDVRKKLFEQLQESRGVLAEAVEEKKDAEQRIAAIQAQREAQRQTLAATARTAIMAAAATLDADPEVQQQLRDARERLGLDAARANAVEAQERVRELRSLGRRTAAILRALWRQPRFLLFGILVFAIVLIATPWLLERADLLVPAARGIGIAAAWIAGALAALAPAARYVGRAVGWLEDVGMRLEQQRQAEQRQEDLAFQRETMRLNEREREARARVEQLDREIEELRAGRRLQRFIMERHASAEYRQHLGIVNLIRNDFEQLSKLLSAASRERETASSPRNGAGEAEPAQGSSGLPHVDRIILYIDDLDRCPEDRVVEVLQAVHLLLAFPLFVVVVGVDSRWLLLSLEDHYTALRGRSDEGRRGERTAEDGWSTTPQNYLEKIFQIPFTLRPMEEAGFASLVETLLPVDDTGVEEPSPAPPPPAPMPRDQTEQGIGEAAGLSLEKSLPDPPAEHEEEEEEDGDFDEEEIEDEVEDVPALPPNPQGLTVDARERDLIQRLHPLIASPRALKRFTNVYRFLRVQQRGADLQRFRGTNDRPGEFEVAAVLLAALVGYPAEASHLLHHVLVNPGQPWWELVEAGKWTRLHGTGEAADAEEATAGVMRRRQSRPALRDVLLELRAGVPLEGHAPGTFTRWTREVARFSFQSGRILTVRQREAEPV